MNYLVTGTDTAVGKTFVTCGLIRAAQALGRRWIGMKPFCTGDLNDVEKISAANRYSVPQNRINPVWFRAPIAPYAAALIENRMIDVRGAEESYSALVNEFETVLVEGAGGLLVPIWERYDFRDLAVDWKLGVILVVANKLGAINHARLTIEAIQTHGLKLEAMILNQLDKIESLAQQTNLSILAHLSPVPPIAVAYGQSDFGDIIRALGRDVGQ
jgi:dethiobiotin synthetase